LKSILLLLWLSSPQTPAADAPLTNQAILELVRAGVGDQTIAQVIESHDTAFDVSVDALIGLKTAGLSGVVIRSMLEASVRRCGAAPVGIDAG
jgi:hypothetical protein